MGKKIVGRFLLDDGSPLTLKVMVVVIPPKYVVSTLVYKGKTDPNHYVETFNEITKMQGVNDLYNCHVFSLTLER